MKKFLYFLAGAATAIVARPYVGPAFQKGVQYTLKSFEEAQRELERKEAANGGPQAKGAAAPPAHSGPSPVEPERRPVGVVGANA